MGAPGRPPEFSLTGRAGARMPGDHPNPADVRAPPEKPRITAHEISIPALCV